VGGRANTLLQMTDKIDSWRITTLTWSSIVARSRAPDGQCHGGHRARPHSDSIVRFALEGTDHRLDAIEKLPAAVEPASAAAWETHCGRARHSPLLRATQDTPHRSRPRATAVTCLVDYRTSDHSMDAAVADPACELARLETSGRPAVLVEGPNRQAGKCLRSSSNCPPSRGLLTNVREVATHPDSDFSRPISRSKEWIARGVAIAHEKRRPWHWTSGNSSRTVNAGRPSR